jgi:MFS transporter, FLVCR family, feline leukemia virus subgroup C receptor-related protein
MCIKLITNQNFPVLKSKPPTPPSSAEAQRKQDGESIKEFLTSIWKLMKDPSYLLLFFNYSINAGAFSAIATFLNQMILNHFPVNISKTSVFI